MKPVISPFTSRRKSGPIALDGELYERACNALYGLHSFLVEKEARARCRKARQKKKGLTES